MIDKTIALMRKKDVEDALRRSLVDEKFIPRIVEHIPVNTVDEVLHASGIRQQLEIALNALNHIAIKQAKDGQAKYAIAQRALTKILEIGALPTESAGMRRKFDHVVTNGEPV